MLLTAPPSFDIAETRCRGRGSEAKAHPLLLLKVRNAALFRYGYRLDLLTLMSTSSGWLRAKQMH